MSEKYSTHTSVEKHTSQSMKSFTTRGLRRSCKKELYRTIKKLNIFIAPALIEQGEQLYIDKVLCHLSWIQKNSSNPKALCGWWNESVSNELSDLWKVDVDRLQTAFRHTFLSSYAK